MSHVVVVGTLPESLTNFRGLLIQAIVASGHRVTAMSTPASAIDVKRIKELGAEFRSYPVQRSGLKPWRDLGTFLSLRRSFLRLQPDIILAYTIKPIIWGGLAAKHIPDIEFHALVTGLGYAFQGKTWARKSLGRLVAGLYRKSLANSRGVIFQNPDNLEFFTSQRIVTPGKCHVVNGSGIDLARFAYRPIEEGKIVFLLIARLLAAKGLREYAEAARRVRQLHPGVTFRIAGPADPSPDGVPLSEVQSWHAEGVIEYLGELTDVRPALEACGVYVLPSYHEGMPRTVLEAMAVGRPILTTDVPGCRQTVEPGVNGLLVKAASVPHLVEQLLWFIQNRDRWPTMGLASRRIVEERFDVSEINSSMLKIMGIS